MKVDIPKFRRCCCCLPLRQGILIFAYVNLIITILFGVIHILLCTDDTRIWTVGMYRGVVMEAQMLFVIVLHGLDVVFNIVLIIGAHKKNINIMQVYYYYQLTTMIANFLVLLVTYSNTNSVWEAIVSELAVAFVGFVVQIYLLLMIHSEMNKERYQEGRSSFVNEISQVCVEPPVRLDRRNLL